MTAQGKHIARTHHPLRVGPCVPTLTTTPTGRGVLIVGQALLGLVVLWRASWGTSPIRNTIRIDRLSRLESGVKPGHSFS